MNACIVIYILAIRSQLISLYVASMLSDTLNIINVDNFSILYCDILQLLLQILILFLNINFDACDIFYVFIIGDTHTQRAYSKDIQKIFRKRPLDNRTSSRYYLNIFWIYVLFLDITWHIDIFLVRNIFLGHKRVKSDMNDVSSVLLNHINLCGI